MKWNEMVRVNRIGWFPIFVHGAHMVCVCVFQSIVSIRDIAKIRLKRHPSFPSYLTRVVMSVFCICLTSIKKAGFIQFTELRMLFATLDFWLGDLWLKFAHNRVSFWQCFSQANWFACFPPIWIAWKFISPKMSILISLLPMNQIHTYTESLYKCTRFKQDALYKLRDI